MVSLDSLRIRTLRRISLFLFMALAGQAACSSSDDASDSDSGDGDGDGDAMGDGDGDGDGDGGGGNSSGGSGAGGSATGGTGSGGAGSGGMPLGGMGGIGQENLAPAATGASLSTTQAAPVTFDVPVTDDGVGGPLAVIEITGPANGTLSIDGTEIAYTPDGGFFGTDSFQVAPTDGELQGDAVTIEVTVAGTVYYVGPDGAGDDDASNPGYSLASPLATLGEANSRLAASEDRIVLLAGVHTTSTVTATSGVPFHVSGVASAASSEVVVDLDGSAQLVATAATSAHLSNFTVQNSGTTCLDVRVPLEMLDVVVTGCDRGLACSGSSDARLERTNFHDNTASGSGGAIQSSSIGTLTIVDSQFVDNAAEANGAGGAIEGSRVVLEGCVFAGNSAEDIGGALMIGDDFVIRDSVFRENSASDGGAIYLNGDAWIERSLFQQNEATEGQAGALRQNGSSAVTVGVRRSPGTSDAPWVRASRVREPPRST